VRITGPGVWDLKRAFADFWNLNRRHRLRRNERPLLLETASDWDPQIRIHRNVPRQWNFPIRSMYLEAINRASHNIWLTTAYFLPDQDFVDALTEAARRGVDVRVLLPLKSNHIVADWISRGYYGELLASGARILRFKDAMVHAKTATIDGSWATVGTANIDRLSLQGNYEINLEVIDPDFAGVMEDVFRTDESNCLELTLDEWEARDLNRKFTESFLAPLRPLL
jgi:cardiolipin synthase